MSPSVHATIVAAHAILRSDASMLFIERTGSKYWDGYYSIVAGHLEAGESVLECLRREVREEVGLDFPDEGFSLVHVMHRAASDGMRLDFFFERILETLPFIEANPVEIAAFRFGKLQDVESRVVPYVRKALYFIEGGIRYSWFTDVLFPEHRPD